MAFIMPRKESTSYNGVRGYLDRVGYKNDKERTYEFELYESFCYYSYESGGIDAGSVIHSCAFDGCL